ncbi:Rho-type GTPase activating protein Rga1 [Lecanora helva]
MDEGEGNGSKMDTHNLATVIAPNILKGRSQIMGQDEESFLAIEVVNTLIQYNDEMCEVPEDLQSILNDSSLFNNSSDITTKEILKRFGDIGRSAAHRPQITNPAQAADSPPHSKESNTGPPPKPAAPVITHVDTDPYQWPKEGSSVRHVQGQPQGPPTYPKTSQHTPPQNDYGFSNPKSPYHRRGGSSESQASQRSGGGHHYKHSGWGKQGAPSGLGVTGAG